MQVLKQAELPWSVFSHELVGADHGDLGISVILLDAAPGKGPRLHTHPYDEVLIVLEGEANAFAGDEERQVGPGDVVIVPAGEPHGFLNTGQTQLRQIDIHLSPRFETEWL
jgi:mannose-6-phosphate isomerase-like protein (cupin superfamily)